jgi:hypothetical protein
MPEKINREVRTMYIFTEKFSEGEWHQFLVVKKLEIPGENSYYLLESKMGNRLLMAAEHYENYGIKAGDTLNCHVDKINCSGKIYLEPENPYYIVGQIHQFEVLGKKEIADQKGRVKTQYFFRGENNLEGYAELNMREESPGLRKIKARVSKIRKGILILSELQDINNC